MRIVIWIKENLLGSKTDILITLISAYFIYFISSLFFNFVFTTDWTLIQVNRKILLVGLFPEEQLWRIWTVFSIFSILISATIGYLYKLKLKNSIFYITILSIPFFIFTTLNLLFNILIILFFSIISYTAFYYFKKNQKKIISRILLFSWIVFLPSLFFILVLFGGPKVTLWGGFFVNIVLAVIAIIAGFPLGVFLALDSSKIIHQ